MRNKSGFTIVEQVICQFNAVCLHPHIHCIVPAAGYALDGIEFLHRFTMHILPGRFVKIRRYGINNPTLTRNHRLQFTPEGEPDIQAILNTKTCNMSKSEG